MAKSSKNGFQLQFAPAHIKQLAARYVYEDDTEALQAGRRIAAGDHCRANIEAIFRWKTGGRGISRLRRNSDVEIRDALRLAANAETERAAISVLCGLSGVEIPVASAILTAIDPERYTIIDFRALEALGVKSTWHTVDSYLAYLTACRDLARQNAISLRELDRALWQWSKEQPAPASAAAEIP
ncbi:MAG TPA: hypothetical protein VEU62_10260 [Bryobacterales bacterium]|nr:hypothetical protein [Bryobacterales bacterium]